MNEDVVVHQALPDIKTIENYTVQQLKDDLIENFSTTTKKELSSESLLYHCVVMLTYKYLKNNKIKLEGSSDLDEEDAGIRLGTVVINQRCLVGIQTALTRRLIKKNEDGKTIFGFAAVLDRYSDPNMKVGESGGIGAAFLTEIRNAIIDESRQSPYRDLSQTLYRRFLELLNSENYEYNPSSNLYKIKDPNACDSINYYDSIQKAVNSVEPWYGTDNVYTKKAIEKILLLSYCVDGALTSFDKVFEHVKIKVRDWLINTPIPTSQVGSNKKEKRSDEEGESRGKFKSKGSYVDNYEAVLKDTLWTEHLANEFLSSCSRDEILILEVIFGVKDISLIAKELNVSENMVYKQRKQIENKLKDFMKKKQVDMEEGGELVKAISTFLINAVV
jgi:hypothetical protein